MQLGVWCDLDVLDVSQIHVESSIFLIIEIEVVIYGEGVVPLETQPTLQNVMQNDRVFAPRLFYTTFFFLFKLLLPPHKYCEVMS